MDDLNELLKHLSETNPTLLKQIEEASVNQIKQEKVYLHETFFKNPKIKWEDIIKMLSKHENNRLDLSFNAGDKRMKVVFSYRNLPEKLEEKGVDDNNGNNQTKDNQ